MTLAQPMAKIEDYVIERASPVTGHTVSVEPAHDLKSCQTFVAKAAAAFPAWSDRPAKERAGLLSKVADRLEANASALRAAMIDEIGAPGSWADHNIQFAAKILRETGVYADQMNIVEEVSLEPGTRGTAERVACGVCLAICPWNAPLILGVRSVAAPLLCGNTVLMKGNEIAPKTFRLLGACFIEAGIPEDVARVVLTRGEDTEAIVEAMIASLVVRRVNFTGSTRVGRRVAELCAKHLKRPLLELGGQATMLVLDDANLDLAAELAVQGAYRNQGQICMSTERLIVADSVADDLIGRIETRRAKLLLGDPADPTTDLGPVIDISAAERLSGLIGDAISKGAVLVGGGGVREAFVEPTLLDAVEPDMRLYREEVFGPILSVTRVADDLEAITVANDSEYGLSASVFSGDPDRAETMVRQIHSGICHINSSTVDDNPHAPFGGVKSSGYGRFGGKWAIDEFTELRWITRASS